MSAPPATPVPSLPSRLRSWVGPGFLLVATLLAYSNSLPAPFVYDDILAIPENASIRHLWPLGDVLRPPAEGGLTVSGRPMLNLSFALNYAISGPAPWSYHVVNILIHAANALLLFGILRRVIHFRRARAGEAAPADGTALAIAALWALHPLQTQAVTYTVQRAESLMGFFYLLTLYAFGRAGENTGPRHSRRWLTVAVLACALGMGTKEVMATAPLLVLLYDRTFVAGSFAAAWRQRWRFHVALMGTWLVLAALVLSTGGNRGGTVGLGVGVPWWAYGLTQFKAVTHYLVQTLWPSSLIFEYGTFWAESAGDVLPYAVLVLPLLIATGFALWRWPAGGFLGAWFLVILAPTSLMPGTIQMIVEHRMYLPLAAVLGGGGWLLHQWLRPSAITNPLLWAAALALGVLAFNRNYDYRSHLTLWSDTVVKRPQNPRAHEGLAEAWAEVGRADLALHHRAESIRLRPGDSTYHYNLGLAQMGAGKLPEAVRSFQQSLRLAPAEPRTHTNLAIVLAQLGQTDEAFSHYAEAVRLKPDDPQFHYNYGIALYRTGRSADAIAQYEAALHLRPRDVNAHYNLGIALVRAKRLDEACTHFREALKLRPEDADMRSAFAAALLLANESREAEAEFRRVLASTARSVDAVYGLGNALAAQQRLAEAATQYDAVLRLQPDHANAHYKLGNVLLDLDRVPEAAAHFEAAARLMPQDAESHHNLGVAYARQERWVEAQREFETALRLKPDYPEARRNLEQLHTLLRR